MPLLKKLGYAEKGTAKVKVEAITFDVPGTTQPVMLASNEKISHTHQLYLQVGAFNQMTKAEQVKVKVAQLTHQSARIEKINLNDHTFYRVQIGPLQDLQQSAITEQLEQKGYSGALKVFS